MINLQLPQIHIVPFAAIHRIRLHPQLLYSKEAVKISTKVVEFTGHPATLEQTESGSTHNAERAKENSKYNPGP